MKIYLYDDYKTIYPEKSHSDLTDALILRTLSDHGINMDGVRVMRDPNNKPFITGNAGEQIHVSCSHSAGTFACLISDKNCGIDIQEKRQVSIFNIASRYFSVEEQAMVNSDGLDGFYKIWTRREAYAKYTGVGIKQVMSKTSVLGREDVTFEDNVLDNGMYCSICY